MTNFIPALAASILFGVIPAGAHGDHILHVVSPNHGQTFAYGSETRHVWKEWGSDRHLALLLDFTNDPYVDNDNPRQYDSFQFDFPTVRLGADGRTFYESEGGRSKPVAEKRPGFLGISEIRLLSNSRMIVRRPHGHVTVVLEIAD